MNLACWHGFLKYKQALLCWLRLVRSCPRSVHVGLMYRPHNTKGGHYGNYVGRVTQYCYSTLPSCRHQRENYWGQPTCPLKRPRKMNMGAFWEQLQLQFFCYFTDMNTKDVIFLKQNRKSSKIEGRVTNKITMLRNPRTGTPTWSSKV